MSIHQRRHPSYVEGCDACRWGSLQFSGYRMTADGRGWTMRDAANWDNFELTMYERARKEGSQPWGTGIKAVTTALSESDRLGKAFRGDDMVGTYADPELAAELKKENGPPVTLDHYNEDGKPVFKPREIAS